MPMNTATRVPSAMDSRIDRRESAGTPDLDKASRISRVMAARAMFSSEP